MSIVLNAASVVSSSPRAPMARARSLAGALAAGLLVATSALGCAANEDDFGERSLSGSASLSLVSAQRWQPQPHFEAPQVEGAGPKVTCDERAVRVGGISVEVSTKGCNFALLTQPTLVDIEEGDEILVRTRWEAPSSAAPATEQLSVFLGFSELWQERVAVPGRPDMRETRIVSAVAAPAGTLLSFYVEGPGVSEWSLDEVSVIKAR